MQRDHRQITRTEFAYQSVVLSLASGCWAKTQYPYIMPYFRERVFGNCRSLSNLELAKVNLYGMNLRGADLRNANLAFSELSNADLSQANLSGAKFENAVLLGTNLSNSFAGGADFSNTGLGGANLNGANLKNANLNRSILGCLKIGNIYGCTNMEGVIWDKSTNLDKIQGVDEINKISLDLKIRIQRESQPQLGGTL
jgi:uncharacterized protein YjbI with pentapeptide repeats